MIDRYIDIEKAWIERSRQDGMYFFVRVVRWGEYVHICGMCLKASIRVVEGRLASIVE